MDIKFDRNNEIQIPCPVCGKEKNYGYNASGQSSSRCGRCRHLILWDYDRRIAVPMKNIMKCSI